MTILLNTDQEYIMHDSGIPLEMDLCALLQNMKLHYPADANKEENGNRRTTVRNRGTTGSGRRKQRHHHHPKRNELQLARTLLFILFILPKIGNKHPRKSDGESSSSQSSEPVGNSSSTDEDYGCAYLQSVKSRLDLFTTTGGGYLEAIFTHREICGAYPAGHTQCPRALSDIAYALEQRAWRADREADGEAINAFRQEAWFVANMAPCTVGDR